MSGPAHPTGIIELSKAREILRNHAESEIVLDPRDPRPGAEEFIRNRYTVEGCRVIHAQSGVLYTYTGTEYGETEEAALRSEIWSFAADAKRLDKQDLLPFQPTTAKVNNLLDATRALAYLPADQRAPCWLHGRDKAPGGELVALSNGLLHVPTRQLYPHTPHFYSHSAALPFAHDPAAADRLVHWPQFLSEIWPHDPESIRVLQEVIAYLLLPDTSQQKAFLMVGPKRSGKGTLARVIRALLGEANVCAPTLGGLSTPFGLQPLIGRLLAIIPDARLSGRGDQAAIAERLLAISGEDAVTVDRKHLPSWTGHLPTRFLILSNELPRLADTSGALAARFVVLTMERSFYGREDTHLTKRLLTELPGIFAWALEGWDRL